MEYTYRLPVGYIDSNGRLHKRVTINALGGYEEELLANTSGASSAALVSQLLARCICSIGDIDAIDEDIAQRLLVEDRIFLLLKLRLVTFGDFIQAVIRCPSERCGEKIDIDFNISDIQFEDHHAPQSMYSAEISDQSATLCEVDERQFYFRLPNGGDQEAVAHLIDSSPAEALSILLSRCVTKFCGQGKLTQEKISALPPLARLEIEKAIEHRAGDTELNMSTRCPSCHLAFDVPFDIQDFFFGELQISHERLLQEVHYLAYHYHWSEHEILSMQKHKRQRYIDLLSDEIARMNDAAA